jgi:predicted secreted hydrolase
MKVWILNWSANMEGSKIFLEAHDTGGELSLVLKPRKPVVLHGKNGLSQKGPKEGQASYYTSFTDLETNGFMKTQPAGPRMLVKGKSWFDHEFGSNQLAPDQEGWDWFSLHLSDGRDLMAYLLRRKDGSVEAASSGTLIENDGTSRHLQISDILISVLDRWQSPKSKGVYPSRWRLQIPSEKIDLVILPLLADQELKTESSAGVVYWEGAVAGEGTSEDRDVSCEGYVELTGYAGSLGGVF